jgi:hypothetical protein
MALKADRIEESTDISHFYNAGTATRGGVVLLDAANASGAAMDQGANLVKYAIASASDVPIGVLLNDVVNKDLTRTHLNQFKDEVQKGGKVTVMTRGQVTTSNLTGSPAAGGLAFACGTTAGNIATSGGDAAESGALCIGRFLSVKDSDGYAKVHVNLPNFGA